MTSRSTGRLAGTSGLTKTSTWKEMCKRSVLTHPKPRLTCRSITQPDMSARVSRLMPRANTPTRRFHCRRKSTWIWSRVGGGNTASRNDSFRRFSREPRLCFGLINIVNGPCTEKVTGTICTFVGSRSGAHFLRRRHDRFDDFFVAGTAANIAVHEMFEFRFARRRVFIKQSLGRQYHSRRAETALKTAVFDKRFLERMEFTILLSQPLDGQHRASAHFKSERRAGAHRPAVDQ